MKKKVKKYDEDFKKSSVELFLKSGKRQKEFDRELGVISETFRGWIEKYKKDYEPDPKTDQEKLESLRKKLFEKEMENDLLPVFGAKPQMKKTIAIFCKSQV